MAIGTFMSHMFVYICLLYWKYKKYIQIDEVEIIQLFYWCVFEFQEQLLPKGCPVVSVPQLLYSVMNFLMS